MGKKQQNCITWVLWLLTRLRAAAKFKKPVLIFTFLSFVNTKVYYVACFLSWGIQDDYMKTCKLGFFTAGISFVLLYSLSPNIGGKGLLKNQLVLF